ncbi:hypothetical protein DXM29_18780 [Agrobacterium tumefaciens]|jgi:hypothetical protein|nr:hypothetical protein DXM29_18780 [Agrobacterium tumefaciens]
MAPTLVLTCLNAGIGELVPPHCRWGEFTDHFVENEQNEGLPRIEVQIGTSAVTVPRNNRAFCLLVGIPKMATRGSVL